MAYSDSKGNNFTNHSDMKNSQRSIASKMPSKGSPTALEEPDGGEAMGGDPHGVVQQHGPAIEVNVSHGEGRHAVQSTHQDGHTHESEHGSAKEAHQAGMCLSGDCDCGGA